MSNAASRTIGLKPLLVDEYCAKSNSTRSDLIDPFLSAVVPGWSPSRVRRRIATSVFLQLIDIDEAGLRQRLAHLVHVEPEHACRQLLALAVFVGDALLALSGHVRGVLAPDHHHTVVIGHHRIARHDID